jgi:hypothetical protein
MGADDERADDQPQEVLAPVEQATVPFYGRDLVAVRLSDGRVCAVLRWLCEGMQLEVTAQVRRIRRKTALRDDLVSVRVETPGGPQAMPALALHGLPGWLYGIDESRVASPEARDAVVLFQREATDALYKHFSQQRPTLAELAAPSSLVPSEPITKPTTPEPGAPLTDWRAYHQAMLAWIDWQADMEQWRGSVESRLESVEEITRLVPELIERLGPATLSPEHQSTVRALSKRLHELSGIAYPTIYYDLQQAFHVSKFEQVPDERWPDVAEWFRQRIDAAQRRKKS